jgi:Cft2 family RNA processing exonuclease
VQVPPLFDLIHRPTHLITDAYNALESHIVKRQDREEQICKEVVKGLRAGGKVLLPCDAAGNPTATAPTAIALQSPC